MIRVNTRTLGVLVLGAVFGGIALSAGLGLWKTQNTKEPARIKTGEFAGMPSPGDIRGSYTWADVGKAFNIPVASILTAFGAASATDKANSLEAKYAAMGLPAGSEIGTDSVRLFVALYTGLPHAPEADTILPLSAIAVLRAEGRGDRAAIEAAATRAFPQPSAEAGKTSTAQVAVPPAGGSAQAAATSAPAATALSAGGAAGGAGGTTGAGETHVATAGTVTGKTTFGDLKSWGFDLAAIEALLGGLGKPSETVRDYCAAKGLSFSEMKERLSALAPK